MRRSVALAALLVVLLLGFAALLYERVFDAPVRYERAVGPQVDRPLLAVAPKPPAPRPSPRPAPSRRPSASAPKEVRAEDAGPPSETSKAGSAPARAPPQAEVIATRGLVQTRGQGRTWRRVLVGQKLLTEESVRTGRDGEADVRFGEGVEVRLSPRSEFSVRELDEAGLARIRLEEGRVAASVRDDDEHVLKVETRGSDAVATSRGGDFGVVADGRGQLTVATTTGSVKLIAKGRSVDVETGTMATFTRDADGPSAPRPVPRSLLLKLGDVPQRRTNQATTTIEGQTDPGSVVRVGQRLARVDARGRFRVKISLDDGENRLSVSVRDAMGRERTEQLPAIVVDRERPTIETDMQWGDGE